MSFKSISRRKFLSGAAGIGIGPVVVFVGCYANFNTARLAEINTVYPFTAILGNVWSAIVIVEIVRRSQAGVPGFLVGKFQNQFWIEAMT